MTLAANRSPDRWLYFALLLSIMWLPIPLGSNRALWWGLLQVIIYSILSGWLLLQLVYQQHFPPLGRSARFVLLLFVVSLAYQLLLVVPLPLEAIRVLSPAAYEVYTFTLDETAKQTFSLSLDIGLTLEEFLKSAAYVSIFFLTLALVDSRKRLSTMIQVLVVVGFAQAFLGLLDVFLDGVFFRNYFHPRGAGTTATGTYVNPNHFGGLLEMAIPLTVGLLIARTPHFPQHLDWRKRVVLLANWLFSRNIWLYLYLMTMITALLYTKSRGAVLSLAVAAAVVFVSAMMFRRSTGRKASQLTVLVISITAGLWLGGQQIVSTLEREGIGSHREMHRETALQAIADYPVFGFGPGNWRHIYMMYQNPEKYYKLIITHAHNDYLELLAEQGAIGFIIFGSAVLIALGTMIGGLRRRRDPLMRGVLYGCVTATISLLIHALVDFNFHIPATAAWFSVILAMGLIAARMPHDA